MSDFPERDWRALRQMKPELLNRLCSRILDECRAVIDDASGTPHQRYLRLFDLVQDRNDDVANAFDDMRRSRATERLSSMYLQDLFTADELQRFTPETRESFIGLAELWKDHLRSKGRSSRNR